MYVFHAELQCNFLETHVGASPCSWHRLRYQWALRGVHVRSIVGNVEGLLGEPFSALSDNRGATLVAEVSLVCQFTNKKDNHVPDPDSNPIRLFVGSGHES